MKSLAAALLVIGLVACNGEAPAVIDGSSAAAFEATTSAARDDLPVADRLAFDKAIAAVPSRRYGNDDTAATARAAFDGLTAGEVVAIERDRSKGEM